MYAYRNLETGAIVLSEHPLSRYEHSEKWEAVEVSGDISNGTTFSFSSGDDVAVAETPLDWSNDTEEDED